MAVATQIRPEQMLGYNAVGGFGVNRVDLNVAGTAGTTVIAKAVQGAGMTLTSTGTDAGTGDVTFTNAGVVSFNSRTGAVTPAANDYSFSQISGLASPLQRGVFQAAITSQVSISTGVDTYLSGCKFTVGANNWEAGTVIRCRVHMSKSAVGTGTIIINIRAGTLGTTSDTAIATLNLSASTAAVDNGIFEIFLTIRTIGTTATGEYVTRITHNVAGGGLSPSGQLLIGTAVAMTAFNTTTATTLGVSINGGTGNVTVIEYCELQMVNP